MPGPQEALGNEEFDELINGSHFRGGAIET